MQRSYSTMGPGIVFTLLGAGAVLWSCGPTETTCDDGIGCVSDAGSSGAGAGTSGKGGGGSAGKGGNAQGGSSSGDAGSASGGSVGIGGAGEAGMGGSVAVPCEGACKAPTAVCDEVNDACVECLKEEDCTGSEKKCDGANTCVECLGASDCPSATASRCDGGACVKCENNEDCALIAGKTVCDTAAGECVQCTGEDYAACGQDMGIALVCDSKARTCTTSKEHSADLCKPCVADAHCKLGELCVLEKYDGADVGYFCFWKQGDTANGAPSDCFTEAHPYAGVELLATSVDGTVADICSLRSSTCVARNQFSSKDCKSAGVGDNSLCGFDAPNDAKCDQVGVSTNYRCTMTCGSDEDCPGVFDCNTSTGVCEL